MTQIKLFQTENSWEEEWLQMPEYNNIKQLEPLITATFKFRTEQDFLKFKELLQEHIFNGEKVFDGMQRKNQKFCWYPHKEKSSNYEYI